MAKRCEECAPVINLTALPWDIYSYLIDVQAELKKGKNRHTALDKVVHRIIREHKQQKDQGKFILTSLNVEEKKQREYRDQAGFGEDPA